MKFNKFKKNGLIDLPPFIYTYIHTVEMHISIQAHLTAQPAAPFPPLLTK